MKHFFLNLLLSVFALAMVSAAYAQCKIERENYLGWNAIKLSNGIITLHVVPEIGGRVMQLELDGHNFFSIHPKLKGKVVPAAESDFGMGWKNYGGDKVWTAPQGWERDDQWPGPPDPVLDAGAYSAEIVANNSEQAVLRLTSPQDQKSGVQLGRTITIYRGSSRVQIESFMRNISKRPVRWGIWEVTQHDTTDANTQQEFNKNFWAYAPINPRSKFPKGYDYLFGLVNNPAFSVDETGRFLRVHYCYEVGKVALDSNAGWLAVVNRVSKYGFFETFDYEPNAEYPDNASIEFWLQGAGQLINNQEITQMEGGPGEFPYLMESEVLSPFAKLYPGEEYKFSLSWFVGKTDGPVTDVTPAGAVNQSLELITDGASSRLTGKFAIFHQGNALASFYSASGGKVAELQLGEVTPSKEFVLDQNIQVPNNAYRVSITVRNSSNENLGALAQRILKY